MDPLSVTLVVISLATALKDIIETAQVIKDSFSKLPKNYRSAQKLAQQLVDFLRGMEEMYQEHEETFNKKESLKNAIINLQQEMQSVHEQCVRLIPPVTIRKSKTGKVKFAIYSLWNRNKVEELLSELKDHVCGCMQHFQLLNGIRTGAQVMEIRETLVQYTTHGSAGIHGHNSLGNTSMSQNGLANVSNAELFKFTHSTPMPMTRIANSIPAHELPNAYLRYEIGRVDLSLRSILARWSLSFPVNLKVSTFTTSWNLEKSPVSRTIEHQGAVVHVIRFQSCLEGSLSESWFRRVDHAIDKLITKLDDLSMYQDAIALGTLWADLWRVIMKQRPSRNSSLGLVRALGLLSVSYSKMGNRSQTYSKSEEAIRVLQTLTLEKDDIVLMAGLMLRQAIHAPSSDRSLQVQLAIYAGKMLEGTLGITGPLSRNNVSSASTWVAISENSKISDDDWFTYAASLLHIAKILPSTSFPSQSRQLAKLSVVILNHLLTEYPGSKTVQTKLVNALTYLSGFKTDGRDSNAVAENLKYVQQNVTVLRRLVPSNPRYYVLRLARALWSQRESFVALGKLAEAENTYQDMLSLKDLAAAPLHPDLHIPSETEGDYYVQLAKYYYNDERFSDAVYAAQNAISQYSALEFMDPTRSRTTHISVLISLCKYLSAGCQYDATLSEGLKAIRMIDCLGIYTSGSDIAIIESYKEVLCLMMDILGMSSHPAVIAHAEDIDARIRKLAVSGKIAPDVKLSEAMVQYATLLQKNGMLPKASHYLEDVLRNWGKMFGKREMTKFSPSRRKLRMLLLHRGPQRK